MSNLAFDTYSFVKDLTKTGMKTEQAEVLARTYADLLTDRLATKDDLKTLQDRLNSRIDGVQKDIAASEDRLNSRIEGVEDRLNSRIDGVQKDITASEQRLGLQIVKSQIQTIAAIVGILSLFMVLLQFFGPGAG